MIDLHLHFDGSLPVDTVWNQAIKQNIDLQVSDKAELKDKLSISDDCESLNEYLEKFDLPLTVLQTKDGITQAMEDLIKELVKEDMVYAEIRFAPQLHERKGLAQEEVVEAAIQGVKNGCAGQAFKVQLILCCMRGNDNQEANLETVRLTEKYLGNVVCACDLAGAEAIFKTYEFESLFEYAQSMDVPYTIHAGEADGVDSIRSAIAFGTKRIGHGVRCVEDGELVAELKAKGITLECCPISNLHTKAVRDMKDHPILPLLQQGLKTTINTDNRTVSDTTIAKEVEAVRSACELTKDEEIQLYLNAAEAAFLTDDEKLALKETILNRVAL